MSSPNFKATKPAKSLQSSSSSYFSPTFSRFHRRKEVYHRPEVGLSAIGQWVEKQHASVRTKRDGFLILPKLLLKSPKIKGILLIPRKILLIPSKTKSLFFPNCCSSHNFSIHKFRDTLEFLLISHHGTELGNFRTLCSSPNRPENQTYFVVLGREHTLSTPFVASLVSVLTLAVDMQHITVPSELSVLSSCSLSLPRISPIIRDTW